MQPRSLHIDELQVLRLVAKGKSTDEIAEMLYAHAAFREIDEVAFALPFSFEHDDYVQILTDVATKLGPALGWRPATPDPRTPDNPGGRTT